MPTDEPGDPTPPKDSPSVLEALKRLAGRPGVFDHYQMEGEIARGSMGAILRVYDQDLQSNVAMKVILGQARGRNSRHVALLLEEVQVLDPEDKRAHQGGRTV